jgi:proteasome lid subunit RPN8/RPN11
LEPTLEPLNLTNLKGEIYKHLCSEYPREGCGILSVRKGRLEWTPTRNLAVNEEDFILDSLEFMKIRKYADIVGIVHSHPDCSPKPSSADIASCNALQIPYYIFSIPDFELEVVYPACSAPKPLIGRQYEFGVSDCFELMRDYYLSQGVQLPTRDPFEDNWWEKGLDYFGTLNVTTWGFQKVKEPQKNDLLIFGVRNPIGNHCGVYLGSDTFIHHAQDRLSCRENLYPFWIQHLIGTYRYDKNNILRG